jgi:hypothetical protein
LAAPESHALAHAQSCQDRDRHSQQPAEGKRRHNESERKKQLTAVLGRGADQAHAENLQGIAWFWQCRLPLSAVAPVNAFAPEWMPNSRSPNSHRMHGAVRAVHLAVVVPQISLATRPMANATDPSSRYVPAAPFSPHLGCL